MMGINKLSIYILGAANWFEVSAERMTGVDEAMEAALAIALLGNVPKGKLGFKWPWK